MDEAWKKVYVYGKEYEELLKTFIAEKITSGSTLIPSDFNLIDIIRPTRNDKIGELLTKYNLIEPINILDMGCGLGGTSRYLASLGHTVTGCDVLPQFIELGSQINSLVNLSDKVSMLNKGIYDAELDSSNFDLVITLGVLLNIQGQEVISKLSSFVHPGRLLYIEDYYLEKEGELDDREKRALNGFHSLSFRKKSEFIDQFKVAGLEVVEVIDMSKTCSEFAWNRAERILKGVKEGSNTLEGEVITYGESCPQLLAHLEHFTESELANQFPNVCERIGVDKVYSADKLLRWVGWVLRKSS